MSEERAQRERSQRGREGRLRGLLFAVVVLLYIASVPWYRSANAPVSLVFGLPDWVVTALACYFAIAVLNAFAWWLTEVPDRPEVPAEASAGAGRAERHSVGPS